MEKLRSGGEIADLDVVVGTLLGSVYARARMFRPLAFIAMREQEHNPAGCCHFDSAETMN